jgi:hypothetical protein
MGQLDSSCTAPHHDVGRLGVVVRDGLPVVRLVPRVVVLGQHVRDELVELDVVVQVEFVKQTSKSVFHFLLSFLAFWLVLLSLSHTHTHTLCRIQG